MATVLKLIVLLAAVLVPFFVGETDISLELSITDRVASKPLALGYAVEQNLRLDETLLADASRICVSPKFSARKSISKGDVEMVLREGTDILATRTVPSASIGNDSYRDICTRRPTSNVIQLSVKGLGGETDDAPAVWLIRNTVMGSLVRSPELSMQTMVDYSVAPLDAWPNARVGLALLFALLSAAALVGYCSGQQRSAA